jgi:basic membrane protein A
VGFAYAASVGKAAKDNPDVHFAIVDDASDDSKGANVDQITFAENEGSFLVGAAAALKSGGWVRYWESTLMAGLTAFAPAM